MRRLAELSRVEWRPVPPVLHAPISWNAEIRYFLQHCLPVPEELRLNLLCYGDMDLFDLGDPGEIVERSRGDCVVLGYCGAGHALVCHAATAEAVVVLCGVVDMTDDPTWELAIDNAASRVYPSLEALLLVAEASLMGLISTDAVWKLATEGRAAAHEHLKQHHMSNYHVEVDCIPLDEALDELGWF